MEGPLNTVFNNSKVNFGTRGCEKSLLLHFSAVDGFREVSIENAPNAVHLYLDLYSGCRKFVDHGESPEASAKGRKYIHTVITAQSIRNSMK